jgi:hypothetical protein
MNPPARLVLGIAAVAALAFLPDVARAQPARRGGSPPIGQEPDTTLFRGLLRYVGFKPIDQAADARDDADTLLVLFGSVATHADDRSATSLANRILRNGGAVLVATDQKTNLDGLLGQNARLWISGRPVEADESSRDSCLGGLRQMPYLAPPPGAPEDLYLARMAQLQHVATNVPSVFDGRPDVPGWYSARPFGILPPGCRYGDGRTERVEYRVVGLSITPIDQAGRATVFTDAGIFTNQMLTAKGTDNLAYSFYLAKYLADRPDGTKRTKCLFYENGELRRDFEDLLKTPAPPMPSLEKLQEKLVDTADRALDELQTRDTLGRAVGDSFPRIAPVLATIAAAFVALVLLRRTWAARHDADNSPAPRGHAGSRERKALDFRRAEILRTNDVYEPLREHLRAQFARWGMPSGGPEMPPIVARAALDKRLVTAKLAKLWEIAYGEVPVAVPFVRWKELEPMVAFVARAAEAGRWPFADQGGGA